MTHPNNTGESVAHLHKAVQKSQDDRDADASNEKQNGEQPVQTGTRDYPGAPLPSQHLDKPGMEAEMVLKPQFMAPDYRGSGKLAGMVAIITGGDSGIVLPIAGSVGE